MELSGHTSGRRVADARYADPLSCQMIANQFGANSHSEEAMCGEITNDHGRASCCEFTPEHLARTCCVDKTACTLSEVFTALQRETECHGVRTATGMYFPQTRTCATISTQFNQSSRDMETTCADIAADNGNANCCQSKTCCADPANCTLPEVYTAVQMTSCIGGSLVQGKDDLVPLVVTTTTYDWRRNANPWDTTSVDPDFMYKCSCASREGEPECGVVNMKCCGKWDLTTASMQMRCRDKCQGEWFGAYYTCPDPYAANGIPGGKPEPPTPIHGGWLKLKAHMDTPVYVGSVNDGSVVPPE